MSAGGVLHRLLKLNLSAPESRRVLNNFLHFEGYGYFVSTLRDSDVLSFANFLDKVRKAAGGYPQQWLIGDIPGLGRDTTFRQTLEGMPGRSSTDMRGSNRSPCHARLGPRTDQKREHVPRHKRRRSSQGSTIQTEDGSRQGLACTIAC